MINVLPYDITHLIIGIQKVAELINKCLVLAVAAVLPGHGLESFDAVGVVDADGGCGRCTGVQE